MITKIILISSNMIIVDSFQDLKRTGVSHNKCISDVSMSEIHCYAFDGSKHPQGHPEDFEFYSGVLP